MTAADHLSKKQFYHGSGREFEIGEHLLSPRARNDLTGGTQMSVDPDSVFITNSWREAGSWGKHIYRVEPHSEPKDTGYMSGRPKTKHYTTQSATIVKRVR